MKKKKSKVGKKKRKAILKKKRKKRKKTLWIIVIIHIDLGMKKKWFSPYYLNIVIIFYVFLCDAPTQTNNTYNPVSLVFPLWLYNKNPAHDNYFLL
jgi:hypothetical protein